MSIYNYALLLIFLSQVLRTLPNTRNSSQQVAKNNPVPARVRNHVQNALQPNQTFRRLHKVKKSKKFKSAKSHRPVGKKRFRKKLKENVKSGPNIVKFKNGKRRIKKKGNRRRKIKGKRLKLATDLMPQDAPVSKQGVQARNKKVHTRASLAKKKNIEKRLLRKVRKRRKKAPLSSQRRKKMRRGKLQFIKKSGKEKSSDDVLEAQNISGKEQPLMKSDVEKGSTKEVDQGLHKIDKTSSTVAPKRNDEKTRNEHVTTQTTKASFTIATEESSTTVVQEMKIDYTSTTAKFGSNLLTPYFQQPRTTTLKTYDPDIADLKKIQDEYDRNITLFSDYYLRHKRPRKPTTTMSPAELDELEAKWRKDYKNLGKLIPDMCSKHYQMAKRWSKQSMGGISFPDCTPDGKYEKTQCNAWRICTCVDPDTGSEVPGNCWKPSKHEQEEIKRREEEAERKKHDKQTKSILHNTCILPGEKCALFDDIFAANLDIPIKVIKSHNERTNSLYNTAGRSRQEIEERAFEILKNVRDESRFCSHFVDRFPFLSHYVHRYTETCRRTYERFITTRYYTPFDWKESALRALKKHGS